MKFERLKRLNTSKIRRCHAITGKRRATWVDGRLAQRAGVSIPMW
jgi:hypothetical protein